VWTERKLLNVKLLVHHVTSRLLKVNKTLKTKECMAIFPKALGVIFDSAETKLYNCLFFDHVIKKVILSHTSDHDLN
jgi:hypothetical protein